MAIQKCSAGSLEAKALRQKFGDQALLRALVALVENHSVRPEFINHLATGAARRTRNFVISFAGSDNSHGDNLKLRAIFSDGRTNRGPLRAVSHAIRRVFHVASREPAPLRSENRRSHPKLGKWRVSSLRHSPRRAQQAFARDR